MEAEQSHDTQERAGAEEGAGAPRAPAAILAEHLTKIFGDQTAVDDVSFEVPAGSIFGYVGPSGSGKTTTVRMLTGVYPPTEGRLSVLGAEPTRFTGRIRSRLGYLPQHFVLYPELTVRQNLSFAASMYGLVRRRKRSLELLDFVELSQDRHKLARDLSGGMQRRLALAATLIHDPDLLFLDEPTAGVDPVLRRKFWDGFRSLRDEGKTLFITTQYVAETAYCDLVGVMVGDGRLLAVDTPDGLRRRAFGGDLLHIRFERRVAASELDALSELPFAVGPARRRSAGEVVLPVEEARRAIPELIEWAGQRDLPVDTAEEAVPSYDDVFVELMQAAER